jgi:hypothetical protein
MNRLPALFLLSLLALTAGAGCKSPYYADRGALFGGLTGAGVGALVGDAAGNTGAGAVIGTALGAMTGAAVGDSIDADLARSRAEIEARMGRQMQGAVTPQDVVAMTQAGLSDDVISTHIRANGMAQPLGVNDLINLRNVGVRDSVINTMQQTPPRLATAATAYPAYPAREVVVEHHYGYPPPPVIIHRPYCPPHRGHVGWGFSIHK